MEGKTNFQGAYRLSGTGIVECLEISDVGCNLIQFDGLTWLTLTLRLYDRSTPLIARLAAAYEGAWRSSAVTRFHREHDLRSRAGLDHAQVVSAQAVVQAAGDRASRFRANGRRRRHGPARLLDRVDAAAGEESTWNISGMCLIPSMDGVWDPCFAVNL